jgi:hypothetical protein
VPLAAIVTADGEKVRSGVVIVADNGAGRGGGAVGGVGAGGCAGGVGVGVSAGGVPPVPLGGIGAEGDTAPPPPQPYRTVQRRVAPARH